MGGRGLVRIGCSGWNYAHWRGRFYPQDLPERRWLEHYVVSRFDTVELNGTFYRLPSEDVVRTWARTVPRDFVFAWKASRFLTHNKKLLEPREPLRRMLGSTRPLGSRLGPLLFQLPPGWHVDADRLRTFLRALPQRCRAVVEVRDPSWYCQPVLHLLEEASASLCLHDMPESATGRRVVGPFAYVRFHGAASKYAGGYGKRALGAWARWIVEQGRQGRDVYAYFNNDVEGRAPEDAAALREAVARLR